MSGDEISKESEEGNSKSSSSARTTVSNAKFEVEKFDGTNNFGMWQCEVLDVLVQQDLDITLEDKPKDMDEKEWSKINRQACGTIRLCLVKDQKYFVMKETLAKDLWKKLEDKYMTKSIENRLYLKKKLFRFQYQQGTTMSEHLNDYNKILADLKNLDFEIDDEDNALLLLNSLPDTYEHLITTLLYGKDKIKFDDVCNALMNNEYRKKDQQVHRDSAEALVVRGRSEEKKFGKKGKSRSKSRGKEGEKKIPAKDECAFCRQKGHWKKDCPKLKNRDKKDSDANVVHAGDDDSDFSLAVATSGSYSDEWLLDSACSYHMCPNREWFLSLTKLDGGIVLMGNDNPCKIEGIGRIRLKLHDGTVKVLKDVRYILDLKKNLISVGFLDSQGFKINIKDGLLKVVDGALVLLKGTRRGNLYFLQGNTITGGAAVSQSSGEVVRDTTKLWHMRLGHPGEKALQDLVKQGLLKGAKMCKLDFCEHCVLGKQTRVKFGTAIHQTKGILDYVHTDVWGPTKKHHWEVNIGS